MSTLKLVAAGVALAVTPIVLSPPAAVAADTRPCVTRAEYSAVHRGMFKRQVVRIWDGRGRSAEGGRFYRACGGGYVGVNYDYPTPRVLGKWRAAR